MAIAGLVLGILGVTVFCWLGPAVGALWSASEAVSASAAAPPTWPVWVMGLILSVGVPAAALFLSIGGLRKNKGIAIGGLITSGTSMIFGFILTMGAAFALNVAGASTNGIGADILKKNDRQQMQNTLDPAFQENIKRAMEAAAAQSPQAPSTGAPSALMPGQTPPAERKASEPSAAPKGEPVESPATSQ